MQKILIICCFTLVSGIFADGFKPFTAEITSPTYIYSKMSMSSAKKKSLKVGDKLLAIEKSKQVVEIDDMQDNWYRVSFKGTRGWVFGGFIKFHRLN